MTTPKYKLTMAHLEKRSNIHKLERDGFTSHDIHKVLYNEGNTSQQHRERIISHLYDRQSGEK